MCRYVQLYVDGGIQFHIAGNLFSIMHTAAATCSERTDEVDIELIPNTCDPTYTTITGYRAGSATKADSRVRWFLQLTLFGLVVFQNSLVKGWFKEMDQTYVGVTA